MNEDELITNLDTCGKTFFVVNFDALRLVFAFPEELAREEMKAPENFYGAMSYAESGNPLRLNAAKKIFDAHAEFDALKICSEANAALLDVNELRISGGEVIANAERLLKENGAD